MKTDDALMTRRNEVRADLAAQAETLKSAVEELNGEREPENPVLLVKRIRGARKEIRRLLDEAEALRMEDPIVKRLRAAHPPWPAN